MIETDAGRGQTRDVLKDLVQLASQEAIQRHEERAAIVPPRARITRERACLIGLGIFAPILAIVMATNVMGFAVLDLLTPAPTPEVARLQAEETLKNLVHEIERFREDYSELPDGLAEVGSPPTSVTLFTHTARAHRAMAVNSGQASYAASCGGGAYAPSIVWLATPPTAGRAAFIGPSLKADIVDTEGYRLRFTAGVVVATAPATCNGLPAGQAVQSYYLAADPLQTGSGLPTRYFGTSSSGTIFQSTLRVGAYFSGVPAAPAKPIQ